MVGINGEEWDVEKIGGLRREALGVGEETNRSEVGHWTGFQVEQS
jgi:hypothetical protein